MNTTYGNDIAARPSWMTRLMPLAAGILLIAGGCVGAGNKTADGQIPPRYSVPVPEQRLEPQAEGTIYSESYRDFYRDSRARDVGDILVVKIVESSSGAKKAETKTSRDSKLSGGIAALFGFEKWAEKHNANFTPSTTSLQTGFKNEFDGSGETKRDSKVTATLSARVIERTMEGNLQIQAFREIRVNNEVQHIVLSGLVRPQDIAADNSILSSLVADARINYTGDGVIADKQQPGWLARGLDVVWPF